jgi:pilus assembly protein CpaE
MTMQHALQVLGVVRSLELQRALAETIGGESGWTIDIRQGDLKSQGALLPRLARSAGALLVEVDGDDEAEMEVLGALTVEAGAAGVPVLATAADLTGPSVRRLLRHGIADFLPQPLDPRDVLEALQNLRPQSRRQPMPEPARGRVLTFSRASGGAGATTLAVNVAHALARPRGRARASVCLLDLDLHFGTAALRLDLPQTAGLLEIVRAPERLDAALFASSLVEHRSGLRVLPAPSTPMPLEALQPDLAEKLLDLAQAEFDYVIVDLPIALTRWTETVLNRSDLVYLVTQLNVPAVRQLRRLLDVIEEAGLYNLPVQLVLNRLPGGFAWGAGIKRRQAEKALGRSFDYCIRDQFEILNEAANRGCPVLDIRRYSRFGRQLRGMLKRSLQELATRPGASAPAAAR